MRYLLLAATLTVGCGEAVPTRAPTTQTASLATATFKVDGMTCGSCEVTIRIAATKLDGVESVEVSYDTGSAIVRYDPATIDASTVAQAITDLGYPATVQGG